ncbi:MAG TPA: ComEC/Rec2 family competence protein [Pseudolabrys sp.]|nr:ComEC/Rec2 family competence protein [Pseudolabrys sp.]
MTRHNGQNGRAGPRAKTWAPGIEGIRPPAGLLLPDGLADAANRLRGLLSQWIAAEVAPGRLMPWLPVAFGAGIAAYFAADREPAWWASMAASAGALAIAFVARHRAIGFPLAIALAAAGTGFATATLQTARIAHPILQASLPSVTLAGFVEIREERERSDRIVVRVERFDAHNIAVKPARVRVAVRKGTAPAVGSFVEFKAHFSPPMQPLRPGGYDFARDMFFQQIGASGYALGKIKSTQSSAARGLWLQYSSAIDAVRESIDKRIRSIIAGDDGSIASALITGKRDAISTPVNDAMYVSSLAHVLSISGYHMAVVAGIVFFVIRAVLALIPSFAGRHPIKKWAAGAALLAATFYLLLSGVEVATQRSYIMIAIVLLGVIFDRPTLTFRTIAVAAIAVLIFAPQAIVHPSFQMSFAATLALIATYQHGLPWKADPDSSLGMRLAFWGIREIASLLLASLVAGLATTPYAAYHFHRLAPYGVLANLLAMPIVSAVVMPMGILGVLTMPLGFDDFFWRAMAWGIDWMNAVALWVASIPGAVGRVHAFDTGPLLLGTAALLMICLMRTPLRWSGALAGIAAIAWAVTAPQPDILVAGDGHSAAFRAGDGRLSALFIGRDEFAIKEWLAADADGRSPKDASLKNGVTCDAVGCIGRIGDGRLIAFSLSAEALAEDCMRASVVITQQEGRGSCQALMIDRTASRARGAIGLHWTGERLKQTGVLSPGHDRPWAHHPTAISADAEVQQVPPRRDPGEAAPRAEDRDADD